MTQTHLVGAAVLLAMLTGVPAQAQPADLPARLLAVQTQPSAPELVCPVLPPKPKPAPKPAEPVPAAEPLGLPDAQEVQAALNETTDAEPAGPEVSTSQTRVRPAWRAVPPGEPFRVAFWGDSHLAAGFFTQALARRLGLEGDRIHSAFIPATLTRPGVRLPVRKACASPEWRHESAHAVPAAAQMPGPALVSQVASKPGARLAWDLRDSQRQPVHPRVRLLYQQTEAPIRIALAVDGGLEQDLLLQGVSGPAVLELQADAPMSTLQLRLQGGTLRSHGLALAVPPEARLQLDLFALPGATVRGWQNANLADLTRWFAPLPPYQLVVLAFGTNEGNEKPFDAAAYGQTLRQSVAQLRQAFPQSACLLIGPGDRGVLVPRAARASAKKSAARNKPAKAQRPAVDLLKYANVHAQINRIQHAVARELGCQSWSMMQAMGGKASAYRWVRQRPPLMANDLIHFTVPGYQRLADLFADQMGWSAQTLWQAP